MEFIKIDFSDSILIITLFRPKALNALNAQMIREIGAVMKENEKNKVVNGVIITGEGEKAFAAGADIKGFPELDEEKGRALSIEGHQVFDYIESYPKPVIAAVNGYALGGGCELTMACHMRIGSENAVFGMPEVKLGLIPGYGGTQRLSILIGKAKAMEYILTADNIDAKTALQLGLVNYVVPQGEEVQKAAALISKISKRGPLAVETAIDCINALYDEDSNGFEFEIQKFGELMASAQGKEGVAAFLEKRMADFNKV